MRHDDPRHVGGAALAGLLTALTAYGRPRGLRHRQRRRIGRRSVEPIQIWEGWTGPEAKAFAHLVAEYEAQHPG